MTEDVQDRPLYARALGLRYLRPGGMLCFFFFEGAVALATLLALAELVSWWAVLVLPAAIAVMVKINDVIAGVGARAAARAWGRAAIRSAARQAARLAAAAPVPPPAPPVDGPRPVAGRASIPLSQPLPAEDGRRAVDARRRQSAAHRYGD